MRIKKRKMKYKSRDVPTVFVLFQAFQLGEEECLGRHIL
jgi:hypothetical protein